MSTLIEFPTQFPIKVMGIKCNDFTQKILETTQQFAPETSEQHITVRESSKGNYLAATVTINATSQEQLDNLYRALTSHPMVKVVL